MWGWFWNIIHQIVNKKVMLITPEQLDKITGTLKLGRCIEMADLIRRQLVRRHGKCMDQGSGYWDCARLVKCVEQQCDDCPLKIPPAELAKEEKK